MLHYLSMHITIKSWISWSNFVSVSSFVKLCQCLHSLSLWCSTTLFFWWTCMLILHNASNVTGTFLGVWPETGLVLIFQQKQVTKYCWCEENGQKGGTSPLVFILITMMWERRQPTNWVVQSTHWTKCPGSLSELIRSGFQSNTDVTDLNSAGPDRLSPLVSAPVHWLLSSALVTSSIMFHGGCSSFVSVHDSLFPRRRLREQQKL